ncbi:hypothetical protein OE88DRAFT_597606 [Heliocybe sulcata]|uniref:Uncharacterized protein n=1 Tax=Heliocybe sulcata TaxID=5364 RepID=A0A5C3MUA3_9AGAM|nr:hypothetical protein OE88DRAFT_597606 [Heliocybe sulcata]
MRAESERSHICLPYSSTTISSPGSPVRGAPVSDAAVQAATLLLPHLWLTASITQLQPIRATSCVLASPHLRICPRFIQPIRLPDNCDPIRGHQRSTYSAMMHFSGLLITERRGIAPAGHGDPAVRPAHHQARGLIAGACDCSLRQPPYGPGTIGSGW